MIFSKRSLRLAVAIATAVGLLQHATAEDGFQTNLLRGNIAFGETIPLELQEVANEVSFSMCLYLSLGVLHECVSHAQTSHFSSYPQPLIHFATVYLTQDQCQRRL